MKRILAVLRKKKKEYSYFLAIHKFIHKVIKDPIIANSCQRFLLLYDRKHIIEMEKFSLLVGKAREAISCDKYTAQQHICSRSSGCKLASLQGEDVEAVHRPE